MNTGERIRNLRTKRGLTQEELAKRIGITRARLAKYETGANQIDNEILAQLAEFFNVTTDYLLGTTDLPQSDNDLVKDPGVQFIMRAREELSPEAYETLLRIANEFKQAVLEKKYEK